MYFSFKLKSAHGAGLLAWHESITGHPARMPGWAKPAVAELRARNRFSPIQRYSGLKQAKSALANCQRPEEALSNRLFSMLLHSLVHEQGDLEQVLRNERALERLALVAIAAANLAEVDVCQPLGRQLARSRGRQSLSEARLQLIAEAFNPENALTYLRDAFGIIQRPVNLLEVSSLLYWWSSSDRNRLVLDFNLADQLNELMEAA